jgi:hypothetical protein
MQPSPVLTRSLLAGLFLLTLSSPAARGQTAASAADKADWSVVVERGKVTRTARGFSNGCPTPNHYRVTSGENFIRFKPKADAVFVGPNADGLLGLLIDAGKLELGTRRAGLVVECLYCRAPTCNATRSVIRISLTVVEPPQRRQAEQPGDGAGAKEIEATLRNDLRRVSDALRARERSLSPLKGFERATRKEVRGYASHEVFGLLKQTKSDLLSLLERKELRPFRDYVAEYFPDPKLNLLEVETGRANTTRQPQSSARLSPPTFYAARAPLETRLLATVESTKAAFSNVAYFIAWAESNGEQITLTVLSDPEEANVELRTVGGELVRATSTNSDNRGFWPGLYHITVKKDGFREVVHERQPLGVPDSVIDCRLVTSGRPTYCRFR